MVRRRADEDSQAAEARDRSLDDAPERNAARRGFLVLDGSSRGTLVLVPGNGLEFVFDFAGLGQKASPPLRSDEPLGERGEAFVSAVDLPRGSGCS